MALIVGRGICFALKQLQASLFGKNPSGALDINLAESTKTVIYGVVKSFAKTDQVEPIDRIIIMSNIDEKENYPENSNVVSTTSCTDQKNSSENESQERNELNKSESLINEKMECCNQIAQLVEICVRIFIPLMEDVTPNMREHMEEVGKLLDYCCELTASMASAQGYLDSQMKYENCEQLSLRLKAYTDNCKKLLKDLHDNLRILNNKCEKN